MRGQELVLRENNLHSVQDSGRTNLREFPWGHINLISGLKYDVGYSKTCGPRERSLDWREEDVTGVVGGTS